MRHFRNFAFAVTLALAFCNPSFGQCSMHTVRGVWGWQSHGTAMVAVAGSATPVPVAFASLGIMDIDREGKYTAHATFSVGGQVQEMDFPGSIQVNADCTAVDTYLLGPLEGTDRLVILDNGNEMQLMPTKHPLGPVTGRAYFRRISWGKAQCTADMVRGEYLGTAEGTYMVQVPGQPQPVPTPFSGIFSQHFRRGGTGTAAATASMAGTIVDVEFPELSIDVGQNCIATVKYTGGVSKQVPGQTFSGMVRYIVLDHGNELIGMETESNIGLPIELENHKRVSFKP